MKVNLSKAKIGQKLLTKHGKILTFKGRNSHGVTGKMYPYLIEYPNGGYGSRTIGGYVMRNKKSRLPSDEDIVEIIK